MVSPVHGDYRRCQAEIPLIVLFRFPEPALTFPLKHSKNTVVQVSFLIIGVFLLVIAQSMVGNRHEAKPP
jgi:uncharacterized membrane protein